MTPTKNDPFWPMQRALWLARRAFRHKEVPVGAVIVFEGKVIARAHNKGEAWKSPLAHAEILALIQAQKKMGSKYLTGCDLYVTLQPCAFCFHGLALARIKRVYFGAYESPPFFHPSVEMIGGVAESECQHLLKDFFQKMR